MKTKLLLFVITLFFTSNVFSQTGTGCWREMSAGTNFCLAIKMDGTLWGWGQNGNLLGLNGNMANQNLPIQIGTDNDWMTVSAGASHSLAVKTNGTLWAWGNGTFGQLGNGVFNSATWTVTQMGTATDWLKVSAGNGFSLAIKNTGTLWSWGVNNTGQLGLNNVVNQNVPVQVGIASNWVQIDAGDQHSLAVDSNGFMYSWGNNASGQLGNGTFTTSLVPTLVGTSSNWSLVSAGLNHSMALDTNGVLYTFGDNTSGQLGYGNNTSSNIPLTVVIVNGAIDFYIAISAGNNFSLAIRNDGTLHSCGYNVFGQLAQGNNTALVTLTQVGTNNNWNSISAGNNHSLAMDTSASIYAAGRDWEGQVGVGNFIFSYTSLQFVNCGGSLATESISLNKIEATIYPNPTSDYVTVDYTLENSGDVIIKLTNLQGQLVSEQKMDKSTGFQSERIDLTKQPTGMYFLSITSENGTFSGKVIRK